MGGLRLSRARETLQENLDRLERTLDEHQQEVGFVQYVVEKSTDELADFVDGVRAAELSDGVLEDGEPCERSDLPTVTREDVGRLALFSQELLRIAKELNRDAVAIRDGIAPLWSVSEEAGAATAEEQPSHA